MGFFSRKQEASETAPRSDGGAFETVRRSPRNGRKRTPIVTDFDGGPPIDPTEATKTRARRRLIGAIALAVTAVVFVPMLFNRTPAPPSEDLALQIPDRDAPFEGRRGVPDAARSPLKPSGDLPEAAAAPTATVATPEPASSPAEAAAVEPVTKAAEPARPPAKEPAPKKAPEKTAEKVSEKPSDKAAEKGGADKGHATVGTGDDPRAIAALEGHPEAAVTTSTGPAAAAEGGGRTYAVQIAAYASPDKARGLREQLVSNGLRSYTESVSTAQGLRTRVRLGPFPSREAADRARAKLKTMKLDGSVVPL
jgi:DedD protein